VQNVAHAYGKTATFMPKPIVGDNGSGMHVHMSLWKDGKNMFAVTATPACPNCACTTSALIKHAKALNAITNPLDNSYKRLVPGFEAPVMLAYSARNRSASIRIPIAASEKARRIETRFPDPTANPYLCFAALMMAGLDGIQNKIHPAIRRTRTCTTCRRKRTRRSRRSATAWKCAGRTRQGSRVPDPCGVFTNDMIDAYIDLKMRMSPSSA